MTDEMRAAWIEACARAICDAGEASLPERARRKLDALDEASGVAARYRTLATAALSVLTPLMEADVAERCAAIFAQKTEAEMEVDAAMSGDFDSRRLALAVRLIAGKIVSQKISAIRNAFPAKGE